MFDQKKYYWIGATAVVVALIVILSSGLLRSQGNFLVEISDLKVQNNLESFLSREEIKYKIRDGRFYIDRDHDESDVLGKAFEKERVTDSSIYLVSSEENEDRREYLERYTSKLVSVLKKYNPHLKYNIELNVLGENLGEKVYGIEAVVRDVLKRDNSKELMTLLRLTLSPVASLKAVTILVISLAIPATACD